MTGVDTSTLLGDEYDAFEAVVSGASSGPLAVIGPPFGGREVALDAAADRLDAVHVCLAPGDDIDTLPAKLGDEPVVIGGCHHLYKRGIGGFAPGGVSQSAGSRRYSRRDRLEFLRVGISHSGTENQS